MWVTTGAQNRLHDPNWAAAAHGIDDAQDADRDGPTRSRRMVQSHRGVWTYRFVFADQTIDEAHSLKNNKSFK